MGVSVAVVGPSGGGKTTSHMINMDGTVDLNPEKYTGMNPKTHFIINTDCKQLPLPPHLWNRKNKNYTETKELEDIRKVFQYVAKNPDIKSVSLDTLNVYLAYKEYNDRNKLTFDQWRDVANDILEIIDMCNNVLREDQIGYIFCHTNIQTDVDGADKRVIAVLGKKSVSRPPEAFFPIVLMTTVEDDGDGEPRFFFETKMNRSTAKTPLGMFNEFRIPNSLALVDKAIRDYHKI